MGKRLNVKSSCLVPLHQYAVVGQFRPEDLGLCVELTSVLLGSHWGLKVLQKQLEIKTRINSVLIESQGHTETTDRLSPLYTEHNDVMV